MDACNVFEGGGNESSHAYILVSITRRCIFDWVEYDWSHFPTTSQKSFVSLQVQVFVIETIEIRTLDIKHRQIVLQNRNNRKQQIECFWATALGVATSVTMVIYHVRNPTIFVYRFAARASNSTQIVDLPPLHAKKTQK